MKCSYLWIILVQCIFYLADIVRASKHHVTMHNPENTQTSIPKIKSRETPQIVPIAFGGVLNQWLHQVALNDTDVRRAAKFAVKYAKRKQPDMFPAKSDVAFIHKVKNISKLKLVYTADNTNPAMFTAMDPVLLTPVTVPLIWGILYTFNIIVLLSEENFSIVHYFSVLEYIDGDMYIVEHSFHCSTSSPQALPFGKSCSVMHFSSADQNKLYGTMSESDNNCVSTDSDNSGNSLCANIKSESSTHVPSVTSKCSGYYQDHEQQSNTIQDESCPLKLVNRKSHFSILSYNIWNTNVVGNSKNENLRYAKRINQLTKLCQDVHADVIAFQEVRFEDGTGGILGPNQLNHLSALLPDYQYVFQPGQVQTHGLPNLIIEGVAIFSRHPIISRQHKLLTRNPSDVADGHQRVLLHAEIEIPFVGKMHVLSTHLSLSHPARLLSVSEIWEYVQGLEGPVFLTGDFNAEGHNEEVRFLAGKYLYRGQRTEGFHDIWETQHGSDKGFTFNTLESQLSKRIDLMFFKEFPGLALKGAHIIDDNGRRLNASSDHLALLGEFAMQT